VSLRKRCLSRCFPGVQFGDFRLHPKGYHPLLGCFGVNLKLKKSLFFTGGSGTCIRADSTPAVCDVPFLLLSPSVASKESGEKTNSGWCRGIQCMGSVCIHWCWNWN
jgi:hypothetical protein